jgi:hypothetical protein
MTSVSISASACIFFLEEPKVLFDRSEKIFRASLTSAKRVVKEDRHFLALTFLVKESFKGENLKEEIVYSGLDSCQIDVDFGHEYLIYTNKARRVSKGNGSHVIKWRVKPGTLEVVNRNEHVNHQKYLRSLSEAEKTEPSES